MFWKGKSQKKRSDILWFDSFYPFVYNEVYVMKYSIESHLPRTSDPNGTNLLFQRGNMPRCVEEKSIVYVDLLLIPSILLPNHEEYLVPTRIFPGARLDWTGTSESEFSLRHQYPPLRFRVFSRNRNHGLNLEIISRHIGAELITANSPVFWTGFGL